MFKGSTVIKFWPNLVLLARTKLQISQPSHGSE